MRAAGAGEMTMSDPDYAAGAAYIDGRYMPIGQAAIPITDWGYRRSDVTYDVVGVWNGAFFRLDDHLRRFRASMQALRLDPAESDDDTRLPPQTPVEPKAIWNKLKSRPD